MSTDSLRSIATEYNKDRVGETIFQFQASGTGKMHWIYQTDSFYDFPSKCFFRAEHKKRVIALLEEAYKNLRAAEDVFGDRLEKYPYGRWGNIVIFSFYPEMGNRQFLIFHSREELERVISFVQTFAEESYTHDKETKAAHIPNLTGS